MNLNQLKVLVFYVFQQVACCSEFFLLDFFSLHGGVSVGYFFLPNLWQFFFSPPMVHALPEYCI